MSDNDGSELLSLGVEVDPSINTAIDEVVARIVYLQSKTQEAFFSGDQAAAQFYESLGKAQAQISQNTDLQIADLVRVRDQIDALSASYFALGSGQGSSGSNPQVNTYEQMSRQLQLLTSQSNEVDKTTEAIRAFEAQIKAATDDTWQLTSAFMHALEEASAFSNVSNSLGATRDQLEEIAAAANEFSLQGEIDQMVALEKQTRAETEAASELKAQWNEIFARNDEMAKGYGVSGGMIGPAEAPAEAGGGGALGGSAYGVARGFRGVADIARIAGADSGTTSGLVGTADLLYVVQGIQQVQKVFGDLNDTLVASGGLFPPLTEGLVALGIPMAGLLSVVVPVGAAVLLLAHYITEFNKAVDDGKKAVETAITERQELNKVSRESTTEDLTKKIGKEQGTIDDNAPIITNLKEQLASTLQAGFAAYKSGDLITANAEAIAAKALQENITKLQGESDVAAGKINNYNQALTSTGVAANDAAEAARKKAEADYAQAKQFEADDNLTRQAAEDRHKALVEDRSHQQQAIDTIKAADAAQGLSAEQHLKNKDAINAHAKALKDDNDELQHLETASFAIIQEREKEARAIAVQSSVMQEHRSFVEQENKLRESGTPDQLASARVGIQSKIAGAQSSLDDLTEQGKTRILTEKELTDIEKYKADIVELNHDLADLDTYIAPLVTVRAAFEQIGKAIEDFDKKKQALEDGLALASASARQREATAEQQYTQGSLQDVEVRRKIVADESRKEIEIKQQTADKIVDIDEQLQQKLVDSATTLARANEDDLVKFGNDSAKLVRQSQYDAEDAQTAHIKRLNEIRSRDDADQIIALQNRNFLAFFQSQLKQGKSVNEEDTSYTESQQKLSTHLKRQQDELAISLSQEQKQRLLDYQRRFEDAQVWEQRQEFQTDQAEQRKLDTLRTSETQQLQDLSTTESYKIQLLQQGLQAELALLQAQETAKLQLLENTRAQIIQQALQAAVNAGLPDAQNNVVNRDVPFFDSGGSFRPGDMFAKGNISESFNIGGRTYEIPGAAMVMPLQSGTATPMKGGGGSTYYFTIQAASDPEATAHAVLDLIEASNE